MSLPHLRDPERTAHQLRRWLASKLLGVTDLVVSDVVVPRAHAISTETLTFRAGWSRSGVPGGARYVVKVAPVDRGVFPRYDLVTEQWVMQALSVHAAAPVPAAPWVETDVTVLGAPFLVMERLPGRVPRDDPPYTARGWVLDLRAEQRARLYDNGLTALAQVHSCDPHALGLDFLDRPQLGPTPLDQQIATWHGCYLAAAAGPEPVTEPVTDPVIDVGFEWIEANRPGEEPTVLNWGSARLGNLLFAEDLGVTGVLDWKMVGLGSPEADLGWWLFVQRHHTEGLGLPLPSGFPDHAATIARYQQLTGHQVRYADFYETFGALRLAILMHRAGVRPSNPATHLLAQFVGAPAPTGTPQSLIGVKS
jgi:aminoglycoside phosphotransferase (APT) family kinase protein